jgi:hypothetical protein
MVEGVCQRIPGLIFDAGEGIVWKATGYGQDFSGPLRIHKLFRFEELVH